MRRAGVAWLVGVAIGLPPVGAFLEPFDGGPAVETRVVLHPGVAGGAFPRMLLEAAHAPSSPAVAAALHRAGVPSLRVDAYLERVFPDPESTSWDAFDDRLRRVREAGAQPILILDYAPMWLADCPVGPPSTNCPPGDLDRWSDLVGAAVARAALAWGVREFEVWNEPDNPAFWTGTLVDYVELYAATAPAVKARGWAHGLDLQVGGPAAALPNPAWIPGFLALARARDLPVDFVSFHWYADSPFLGPLGDFPGTVVTDNPALRASTYGIFGGTVRGWADAAGYRAAEVWIDEWNVNAGDAPRMRGPFGAAFVAAAVDAMVASGAVDRAHYFNVQHDVWGLFSASGEPRPAWNALRTLLGLGTERVPSTAAGNPNVGLIAGASSDGALRALVYHFNPQADVAARVRIEVDGAAGAPTTLRDMDGALLFAGPFPAGGLVIDLPNLALRLLELHPGR